MRYENFEITKSKIVESFNDRPVYDVKNIEAKILARIIFDAKHKRYVVKFADEDMSWKAEDLELLVGCVRDLNTRRFDTVTTL